MLSFASAAYLADKTLVGTFAANLELLPGAVPHPKAMGFWTTHAEAWGKCRINPQDPETAMRKYVDWLKSLPGKPVFVAYPVGFDFAFIYWYLMRFVGESPFGHGGIDIRTYAMAMMKRDYRDSGKSDMPRHWFDDKPHTHEALDDAIEQGTVFCNMLMENSRK
jgi:hypothetical protein